jgi:hypothetical protein
MNSDFEMLAWKDNVKEVCISWLIQYLVKSVENIIVIYLVGSDPSFPANFLLSYFYRQIIDSAHLFLPIRVCRLLPIYTAEPPIILQYRFGLETVWIK